MRSNSKKHMNVMSVTDRAKDNIIRLLQERGGDTKGIRIGVSTKGCSGLSYKIEYVNESDQIDNEEYIDIAADKIETGAKLYKVFIDSKALLCLIGSEMDFVEEK